MKLRIVAAAALLLVPAADAHAQWDAPSFLAPRTGDDIGIYLTDPGAADFGVQGIWRQRGALNVGVRVGYIDVEGDGVFTVGTETWALVKRVSESFPVDASLTFGAGVSFNGGTTGEVPIGLSVGRTADLGPVDIQVYAHPRLATLFHIGASEGEDEVQFDGRFDVGADLVVMRVLRLRFGATVGDYDALGFGLAYYWRRGERR